MICTCSMARMRKLPPKPWGARSLPEKYRDLEKLPSPALPQAGRHWGKSCSSTETAPCLPTRREKPTKSRKSWRLQTISPLGCRSQTRDALLPLTAWTMILVRSACGMIPLRPEPDSRFSGMSRCLTSGNWSKTLGTRNWKNWLHPALRCRSRPNRQHLCSPNRLKQKITALLLPIWEWAARKQSIRRMWLLSGC